MGPAAEGRQLHLPIETNQITQSLVIFNSNHSSHAGENMLHLIRRYFPIAVLIKQTKKTDEFI